MSQADEDLDTRPSGRGGETDVGESRDGPGIGPMPSRAASGRALEPGDHDRQAGQGEAKREAPKGITLQRVLRTTATYVVIFSLALLYVVSTSPKCSSDSVDNTVNSIIENRLLHLKRFSVGLTNIKVLEHDMFGDQKCSADLIIDGKPTFRRVEYHWDTHRGSVSRVYARMTF